MDTVNVGDMVIVVDQTEGHEFPLGASLEVLKANYKTGAYLCTDGTEQWWLTAGEFEKE